MEHVLHVIRHQLRLSKDASSVLIDLGEAVQSNATRGEVDVIIDGTLSQEVYVRNACLQTIQVSIDYLLNIRVLLFIIILAIRLN